MEKKVEKWGKWPVGPLNLDTVDSSLTPITIMVVDTMGLKKSRSLLNRIQGKSMLENLSLAWTYQTLKSSGILRRNWYSTTYDVYERIWNLGEAEYSN